MNAANENDLAPLAEVAGEDVQSNFNFAYLDERTKRMIRRALLKAVAIPGYQVPFGSREMPCSPTSTLLTWTSAPSA